MSLWVYKKYLINTTFKENKIYKNDYRCYRQSFYTNSSKSSSTTTGQFKLNGSPDLSVGYEYPYTGYLVSNDDSLKKLKYSARDLVYSDKAFRAKGSVGKYLFTLTSDNDFITTTMTEFLKQYNKGGFVEEIVAEENAYPSNGYVGNFWYVKDRPANMIMYANKQIHLPKGKLVHKGIEYY